MVNVELLEVLLTLQLQWSTGIGAISESKMNSDQSPLVPPMPPPPSYAEASKGVSGELDIDRWSVLPRPPMWAADLDS